MVMVAGEGRDDAGAELVGVRMRQFEGGHLLQMVMQQPGVVDQGLQDQRLAAGHGAALAAHDRAGRKMRARGLIGPAGQRRSYPLPATTRGESAARGGS